MTAATRPRETASTQEIRRHFPALERQHRGHPVAYFDGPGGTQVPTSVADAVREYLLHHNANTHWLYPTSEETDELIAASRQALADGPWAAAGARATRSSSPSSTIMPMWRPGARSSGSAA